MRNFAIAAVAVLAIAGSTAVYAQHRHWAGHVFSRMNPEDRAAYADDARMNPPKDDSSQQKPDDPVARLRDRAENMAATAGAMKKIAEVADPLYKTLDDGQKRRLAVLTRMDRFGGREGWHHHRFERERGMDRDFGRDRGYDRDRYDRDGGPDRGGPERL